MATAYNKPDDDLLLEMAKKLVEDTHDSLWDSASVTKKYDTVEDKNGTLLTIAFSKGTHRVSILIKNANGTLLTEYKFPAKFMMPDYYVEET